MKKCTKCQADLAPADLKKGKCPKCGAVLAEAKVQGPADDEKRTIADADKQDSDVDGQGLDDRETRKDDHVAQQTRAQTSERETVDDPSLVPGAKKDEGDKTVADIHQTIPDEPVQGATDKTTIPEVPAGTEEKAVDKTKQTVDDRQTPATDVKKTVVDGQPSSSQGAGQKTGAQQGSQQDSSKTVGGDAEIGKTIDESQAGLPAGGQTIDQGLPAGEDPTKTVGDAGVGKTIEVPQASDAADDRTIDELASGTSGDPTKTVGDADIGKTIEVPQADDAADDQTIDEHLPVAGEDPTKTVGDDPGRTIEQPQAGGADSDQAGDVAHDETIFLDEQQPVDPSRKTVADGQIDRTIEVPSDGTGGKGTVSDTKTGGTVDVSGEQPKQEGTVADDQHLPTLDSTEMSVADNVNKTWAGAVSQEATPMTSLKTEAADEPSQTKSDLVIQPRSFQRPEDPGRRDADYDLIELLGEGGMGMVYAARQASIDRTVAIKMLKPRTAQDEVQRCKFLAEAVVTGDLEHPNIVPIYDLGRDIEGALFYAMKRVQGTPWDQAIGSKSLSENIEILMKVADAMAFSHSRGIIHRDLKPENVMLGGFGEVLVMDWGLAIPTDHRTIGGLQSSTSMGGTPAYMAPEMATGPFDKIGAHSDVYLLGAILYEIVTGKPPHTGKDVMKCLFAAAKNKIQETDETSELVDIALQAMATDPQQRHASVTEFQDAIRGYLSHSESIVLSDHAEKDLQKADRTDDYQDFARALFGFQQAVELWDGNEPAKEGLAVTQLAYAKSAKSKGDFDLGASLLTDERSDQVELLGEIRVAKREVAARKQRLKTAKRLAIGLAATVFLVVSGALVMVISAQAETKRQKEIAEEQREEAETQKVIAEEQREEAEAQKVIAEQQKEIAVKNEQKAIENEQKAIAEREKAEAAAIAEAKAKEEAIEERKKAELAAEQEKKAKVAAQLAEKKAKDEEAKARLAAEEEKKAKVVAQLAEKKAKDEEAKARLAAEEEKKAKVAAQLAEKKAKDEEAKAKLAAEQEKKAKEQAVLAQKKAEEERVKAEAAAIAEKKAKEDAVLAKNEAEEERVKAEAAAIAEKKAKEAAVLAQKKAEIEERKARIAEAEAKRQAYTALISASAAKIDENAFDSARQLLDDCAKEFRNWEWGRLWYVCNQSVAALQTGVEIEAIDYHPVRNQIATGGLDGKLRLWEPETDMSGEPRWSGKQLWLAADNARRAVWQQDTGGQVRALAYSPDGRWLAVGTDNQDGYLQVWDLERREPVYYIPSGIHEATVPRDAHTQDVVSVQFDHTGTLLLTSSFDHTAKVWDVSDPNEIKLRTTLRGHSWWVWNARFSPDAKRILTVGDDGNAIVASDATGQWNSPPNIKYSPKFRGHNGPIFAGAFSPNGELVATAGYDQRVLLWRPEDLREFDHERAAATFGTELAGTANPPTRFETLAGHKGPVRSLTFSKDGKLLLTAGQDNTIRVWDVMLRGKPIVLRGHGKAVQGCAISANNEWIVSGSLDGTARLWDRVRYEEQRVLRGKVLDAHEDSVLSAYFSNDGEQIVTASRDSTAKTWTVEGAHRDTFSEGHTLREGHLFRASHAVFFGEDKYLATSAVDNTVLIWDVSKGTQIELLENTGRNAAIAASSDGSLIVTGGSDEDQSFAQVWRWQPGEKAKVRFRLREHNNTVTVVAISPDKKYIATGDANGRCNLWNAEDGTLVSRFELHLNGLTSLAFLRDGSRLLTADNQGKLAQWDLTSLVPLRHLEVNFGQGIVSMDAAQLADETRVVVVCTAGGDVELWDADRGKAGRIRSFASRYPTGSFTHVAFSRDGSQVLAVATPMQKLERERAARSPSEKLPVAAVHIFDTGNGQEISFALDEEQRGPFLFLGNSGLASSASFNSDGTRVVVIGGNRARLWEVNPKLAMEKREVMRFRPHGPVATARFSPDGKHIVTGSWDTTIKIWNTETKQNEHTLKDLHTRAVNSVRFSQDGSLALSASDDGTAKLWEVASGEIRMVFGQGEDAHRGEVMQAIFMPGEKQVATASKDTSVRIWNVADGKTVKTLESGEDAAPLLCLAVSYDGRFIAAGGEKDAKIWEVDADSNLPVNALSGHTASITSVDFSGSKDRSRRLVTGSKDFTAKLWDSSKLYLEEGHRQVTEIMTLKAHEQAVTSVTFSPDGTYCLTGSDDGTAIVWLTAPWEDVAAE